MNSFSKTGQMWLKGLMKNHLILDLFINMYIILYKCAQFLCELCCPLYNRGVLLFTGLSANRRVSCFPYLSRYSKRLLTLHYFLPMSASKQNVFLPLRPRPPLLPAADRSCKGSSVLQSMADASNQQYLISALVWMQD